MEFTKGYLFEKNEDALAAIDKLNKHYGLPVEGGISKFDEQIIFKKDNGYFIPYDDKWTYILGDEKTI